MMNRKQQAAKQAAEAHRINIQRSLQHRLEVAKAQGDEKLIRQLEAEINYFN
jgi:ribosome-binding protein aMBF1 (putative translation factor)